MKIIILSFMITICCLTFSYAEGIYKCLGDDGVITFTTTPRTGCELISGLAENGSTHTLESNKALQPAPKGLVFSERILRPLKWGMSAKSFLKSYQRADESIRATNVPYSEEFYQDPTLPFYNQTSIAGFRFGNHGLDHIIISFPFQTRNGRLYQPDILLISKKILPKLIESYGMPTHSNPWNGKVFNYIWLGSETWVQFAWDGSDGWGIQYRSMNLDPQVKIFVKYLKDSQ
ncbi:MAG: hypothetical protein JEZ06_24330 [Anaerolineaceae bacterium]|nr:hypothetical protein [Anaerolineaceae bacterium]